MAHAGTPLPAAVAVWLVVFSACGPAVAPLSETHTSPLELARAAADAVARRDVEALRGLALDEAEFRDHVWPELPSARPERNLPLSFVWGDLHQKSDASLSRILGANGGQLLDVVGVRFQGATTQYRTYVVHRRAVLAVRSADGSTRDVRLFGSVLAKGGRFKIFSYVVDDD